MVPMKVLIAPDAFKESLCAPEAARAIAAGFRQVLPEALLVQAPLADGGEGTLDCLLAAGGGRKLRCRVTGPLGAPVEACYGLLDQGRTAMLEMAYASGLTLVPPALRNPLTTTSRGTGELIRVALDAGIRHIVLGVGGSATIDGGMGMLRALGVRLLDAAGQELEGVGADLGRVAGIDRSGLDPRLDGCRIEVACDVDNPLTGPQGAAAVFGPQKGATAEMIPTLDDGLANWAGILAAETGIAIAALPHAGAAGGVAGTLHAVLGARLRPGIEVVLAALDFERDLTDADLVVTGEGRMDRQTLHGKVPIGVARLARRHGVPVIGIAGALGDDLDGLRAEGFRALFSIQPRPAGIEDALRDAATQLRRTAGEVAATWRLGLEHAARDRTPRQPDPLRA
jgi:glycerate 2-kinase